MLFQVQEDLLIIAIGYDCHSSWGQVYSLRPSVMPCCCHCHTNWLLLSEADTHTLLTSACRPLLCCSS